MENLFREPTETSLDGIKYLISSSDGIIFQVMSDLFMDGNMIIYNDNFNPSAIPESDTDKRLARFILNKIKAKNKKEASESLESYKQIGLGDYVGKIDHSFQIDIRIRNLFRSTFKNLGINQGQFINQAIIEKLERDGLI